MTDSVKGSSSSSDPPEPPRDKVIAAAKVVQLEVPPIHQTEYWDAILQVHRAEIVAEGKQRPNPDVFPDVKEDEMRLWRANARRFDCSRDHSGHTYFVIVRIGQGMIECRWGRTGACRSQYGGYTGMNMPYFLRHPEEILTMFAFHIAKTFRAAAAQAQCDRCNLDGPDVM